MDIKEESEIFNKAADYYDRYRPSYPLEIINVLEQKTGIKAGSRLLEIGAGSGKATELFIGKGYDILCIEPGEKLVEIGNLRFKDENIRFEKARFEEYKLPKNTYDCIFAAQSFHWIPQPIGFQKCSYTLKKGGYLALIWNMYITYDNPLDNDLVELSNKYGGLADFLSEKKCEERISSIICGIEESGLFERPVVHRQ